MRPSIVDWRNLVIWRLPKHDVLPCYDYEAPSCFDRSAV